MSGAMTNEERFIASCQHEGEAGVRQKVSAGRYTQRRADWAADWLNSVESGKSEATRAEERCRLLTPKTGRGFMFAGWAVFILLVALGLLALVMWR